MGKKFILKIFLLPIIVAFAATCIAMFIDGNLDLKAAMTHSALKEVVVISLIYFLGFYLFIIISALPINMYISKKIGNKLISFVLFNVVGFILVQYTIKIWFFSYLDYMSIYLIFPLFSILSLIRLFD